MFPFGETVQALSPVAVVDEYSQEVTRWSFDGARPRTLEGTWAVEPRSSKENPEVGRAPVFTGLTIYGPVGSGVTSKDRLIVRGNTYKVDGEIAEYVNPYSGTQAGAVINLERVEG